jgi:serine/threonine-protein kinase
MVMEFLNGHDLSTCSRTRALPVADAVDFVLQACEALAEAHALGIVHRDLKPANLFMITGADGAPASRCSTSASRSSPRRLVGRLRHDEHAAIMGSPLYMSPEQMTSSRDVDGRSDIWSVGTSCSSSDRRTPFLGDTMPQLCGMILQEPRPRPARSVPTCPRAPSRRHALPREAA